jgi:hypothetical protein
MQLNENTLPQQALDLLKWLLEHEPNANTDSNEHYKAVSEETGKLLTLLTQYLFMYHTLGDNAQRHNKALESAGVSGQLLESLSKIRTAIAQEKSRQ